MMDATEKRLTSEYNRLLGRLNRARKGSPESASLAFQVAVAYKALRRYQQRKHN